MPTYSSQVELDGVKHDVRVEIPFFMAAGDSKVFFDQVLVGQGRWISWKLLHFEFERSGHKFQTTLVGTDTPHINLVIDGTQVKSGSPAVVPPSSADSSVAKPGISDSVVAEPRNSDSEVAKPGSGYELIKEDNIREDTEVMATEEYPLDNRAGAETLTIEQEISRTASNEITVGSTTYKDSGISVELFNLIKGDLSSKLTKRTGQTLGETVTRRHSIKFSAGPHQAVTYIVMWKRRVRTGNYLVLNNGSYATVPYTAYFDLTFEVQSR